MQYSPTSTTTPATGGRSVFSGFLAISAAVLLTIGGCTAMLNAQCQARFDTNLPMHPQAQVINQDFPYMENKWMEVYVPLPPTETRTWYNQAIYVRDPATGGTRKSWQGEWIVEPADDGVGSVVRLWVGC